MMKLEDLFEDIDTINKIKIKLPYLFNVAEIENSRAGKIGMEVGSLQVIMANFIIKRCSNCGSLLDKIVYTGVLSEEWQWNGNAWECLGHTSLGKKRVCPIRICAS